MDDTEVIVSVWTGLLAEHWPPDIQRIRADAFSTSSLRWEDPPWHSVERACWIARARQNGQLVGFGLLTDCGNEEAVLDEIGVVDGRRGQGIGSAILERLKVVAATSGFALIQTSPMRGDDQEPARLWFFERAGFSAWERGMMLRLQRRGSAER